MASAGRARARASLGMIELLLSRNDLLPGDGVRVREPSASCSVPEEYNTSLCTLASSRRLPVSAQTPSSSVGGGEGPNPAPRDEPVPVTIQPVATH